MLGKRMRSANDHIREKKGTDAGGDIEDTTGISSLRELLADKSKRIFAEVRAMALGIIAISRDLSVATSRFSVAETIEDQHRGSNKLNE